MKTIESCLATREQARWNALCDLSSSSRERFDEAMQTLRRVWQAARDPPIGPAAGMTADEVRAGAPEGCRVVVVDDDPLHRERPDAEPVPVAGADLRDGAAHEIEV